MVTVFLEQAMQQLLVDHQIKSISFWKLYVLLKTFEQWALCVLCMIFFFFTFSWSIEVSKDFSYKSSEEFSYLSLLTLNKTCRENI